MKKFSKVFSNSFVLSFVFLMTFSTIFGVIAYNNLSYNIVPISSEDKENNDEVNIPDNSIMQLDDDLTLETQSLETEVAYSGSGGTSSSNLKEFAENSTTQSGVNMKGGTVGLSVPYGWVAKDVFTNVTTITETGNWVRDMTVTQSMGTGWQFETGDISNPTALEDWKRDDITGTISGERLRLTADGIDNAVVSAINGDFDSNYNPWLAVGTDGEEEWNADTTSILDGGNCYGSVTASLTEHDAVWRQDIYFADHADDHEVDRIEISYAGRGSAQHAGWPALGYTAVHLWIKVHGETVYTQQVVYNDGSSTSTADVSGSINITSGWSYSYSGGSTDYDTIMNYLDANSRARVEIGMTLDCAEEIGTNHARGWWTEVFVDVFYDQITNPGTEAYHTIDTTFGYQDRSFQTVQFSVNYWSTRIIGATDYYPYLRLTTYNGESSPRYRLQSSGINVDCDDTAFTGQLLTISSTTGTLIKDFLNTWEGLSDYNEFNISVGMYFASGSYTLLSDAVFEFDNINLTTTAQIDFSPGIHAKIDFVNLGVWDFPITGGVGYASGSTSAFTQISGDVNPTKPVSIQYSIQNPTNYFAMTGTVICKLNLTRFGDVSYNFSIINTGGVIDNLVKWFIHFQPGTLDGDYLNEYYFEFYTPKDWDQGSARAFCEDDTYTTAIPSTNRFNGPYASGSSEYKYVVTKEWCGTANMDMVTNEYYLDLRFYSYNYLPNSSSVQVAYDGGSGGETIFYPTNSTDIKVSINRPSWCYWTTSYLNVSVFRQINDLNQEVSEEWYNPSSWVLLNHPTNDNYDYDFTINSSYVGEYVVMATWNNSQSGVITEVGFNTEIIQVWRNTSIDTVNDVAITSQEVLDGDFINFTVQWKDLEDYNGDSQKNDNVTDASSYFRLYSDQQGNLTSSSLSWLSNLGMAYNGSNPEVINTNLTSLLSITEISNGIYNVSINTSRKNMVKYTGPGNRTLKLSFSKPFHQSVSFLSWVFITSDTYFNWLTIGAPWPIDPTWGMGPEKIQGETAVINFRIDDLSRMAYEETYWDGGSYEAAFLNNETESTKDMFHMTVDALNKTAGVWIDGDFISNTNGITQYNLKVDQECNETSDTQYYYFNFTFSIDDVDGLNGRRYQAGYLVDVPQGSLPLRDRMTGCLKIQVDEAKDIIQTMVTFNETINQLNSSGIVWNSVTYKWQVYNIYWNETGFYMPDNTDAESLPFCTDAVSYGNFTWDNGIMKFNLTFANDTEAGRHDQVESPWSNGTAYLDNATNSPDNLHYQQIKYYYNVTEDLHYEVDWKNYTDPLSVEQVISSDSGVNETGTYTVTLNVSSVPKITPGGSSYTFEITMYTDYAPLPLQFEKGKFRFTIEILPMEAALAPGTINNNVLPDSPYWGDNLTIDVIYTDIKNNVNITGALVQYKIFYYTGIIPTKVTSGTMTEIGPGRYNLSTGVDTDDFAGFDLPTDPGTGLTLSKTFYFQYNASKKGILNGGPVASQLDAYIVETFTFTLSPRPIFVNAPTSNKSENMNWNDNIEIVAEDTYQFSISVEEYVSGRPLDPGMNDSDPISDVNVTCEIDGYAQTKQWMMSDVNGTVTFVINVVTAGIWIDYGNTRTIILQFFKENYRLEGAGTTKQFSITMIKIPIEIRLVDENGNTYLEPKGSVSIHQSEELTFYMDLLDVAYNEFITYSGNYREKINESATVRYRVMLGGTIVTEGYMDPLYDTSNNRTGRYQCFIDPWRADNFWNPMEAQIYLIVFYVDAGLTKYDTIDWINTNVYVTFNLVLDGFMSVWSIPFIFALIGASVMASIYVSYHGIKVLRVPYILRMIENTNKKITRNRKTHAGLMKSREQLVVESAEIELKIFGIKLEPISAKKLPPPITKLKKEEDLYKFPPMTDEQIKMELDKIPDLSAEEKMLFSKEIKDLAPKDQREFLVGLGASNDLLKIPDQGKKKPKN